MAGHSSTMSVDAKLAAAAAAGNNSSNSANAGGGGLKPHAHGGNYGQHHGHHHHSTASATPTPAHSVTHSPAYQHQHHPAPNFSSLARSKKEENQLLSLPSHDREAWYEPARHGAALGDEGGAFDSEGEDADHTQYTRYPRLTNRGNKLSAGSRFLRKGRLAGWENYEVFESRSAFSSLRPATTTATSTTAGKHLQSAASLAVPPPHGTLDHNSLLGDDAKKVHSASLPTGKDTYPITPSLTFVPSASTAAARPDREPPAYSFLPSPHSPTSPSSLSTRKRKKIYSSYTGLASTSGSSSNHTSAPVPAYLPVPPQNPIELVMSPLITRTFSPRNNALEKLSLHATDLIERDMPLVRVLTRIVDFARGNTIAGINGHLGLPFNGDDEPVIQVDEQNAAIKATAHATNGHTESKNDEDATPTMNGTAGESKATTTDDAVAETSSKNGMDVDKPDVAVQQPNGEDNGEDNEGPAKKRRRTESMEVTEPTKLVEGQDAQAQTAAINGLATEKSNDDALISTHDADKSVESGAKTEAPVANGHITTNGTSEEKKDDTIVAADQAMNSTQSDSATATLASAGDVEMAATLEVPTKTGQAENASRMATPAPSLSVGGEGNEEDEAEAAERAKAIRGQLPTILPTSLQRIANPAPFISSLFTSSHDVRVNIPPPPNREELRIAREQQEMEKREPSAKSGILPQYPIPHSGYNWSDLLLPPEPATLVRADQPQASTSGTSGTPVTSAASAGPAVQQQQQSQYYPGHPSAHPEYRSLSQREQEEAVQLCVQELTKFLSDTLEYRDRLGEIRDSILSIEKRRKGVWTMARSYAHQLLWEEEQDRLAQEARMN